MSSMAFCLFGQSNFIQWSKSLYWTSWADPDLFLKKSFPFDDHVESTSSGNFFLTHVNIYEFNLVKSSFTKIRDRAKSCLCCQMVSLVMRDTNLTIICLGLLVLSDFLFKRCAMSISHLLTTKFGTRLFRHSATFRPVCSAVSCLSS